MKKKKEVKSDSQISDGEGLALWWCFQNIEKFEKKGCFGIQVEMTILKIEGAESRAGNTCMRTLMLWMSVENLTVNKLPGKVWRVKIEK